MTLEERKAAARALHESLMAHGWGEVAEQKRFHLHDTGKAPVDLQGHKLRSNARAGGQWTLKKALEAFITGYADEDGVTHYAAGLGVQLGECDGLWLSGVDIDHCFESGEEEVPEEWAFELAMQAIESGYTERSYSGTGLHHIVIGQKPAHVDVCKVKGLGEDKRGAVEVYGNGRYFTLSGRVEGGEALNRNTAALEYACERFLAPKEAAAVAAPSTPGGPLQDWRQWLEIGLQNDAKLAGLWNRDSYLSGDESSDDLALFNKLAYWLGRDPEAMLAAALESPFFARKATEAKRPEKWNREDYIRRTINKAVAECRTTAQEDDARWRQEQARRDFGEAEQSPASSTGPTAGASRLHKVIGFSDVPYHEPRWLLKPYIPGGAITIIQGDSGVGKTAFVCKLAALTSTGGRFLDFQSEAGNVLILSVEDDPEVLRGRIEASGGDVGRCFFLGDAHSLTFNHPDVETTIREMNIKLAIFDPLQAFMGGKIDMHRANETRPVLAKLAAMLKRLDCAGVIVSHMSKGSLGGPAVNRVLGSVDIVGASRSLLTIARHPDIPDENVVFHTKASHSAKGRNFTYRIGERGGVSIGGYTPLTETDLNQAKAREKSGVDFAEEPLVIGIRKYMAENPKGGRLSYDQLHTYCLEACGTSPYFSNRDASTKINAIRAELARRDKISIQAGAYVNDHETGFKGKGVAISPIATQAAFQTRFNSAAGE